ncbi:BTAD domain-containing putative transcriptional regulator [Acrocarpospora macrocephala]|uniref:SARP family transcriptional regulator n=1 Tax=Acrocarpospora macrocephala TaxID=150177 RepID=A0A5M3X3F6_9ACTN|nr:BTAD domain-containing putative transcriptional regulator [Acrocarpospora macrocephala]GES14171.1 SARP family transcriptional regulator [Acrocarpospora macrocephala]
MRVSILGPLEVVAGGEVSTIGGARLRALLVRLAIDAGRVVTLDQLTEALWGEAAPADRANALQSLVSRLRRALPRAEPLRSAPGGYRLDVPRDDVDLYKFERLAREGRRCLEAGDPGTALARLDDALGLWRGRPLADLAEAPFVDAAISRLDESWLSATEDRIEARLALGSPAGLAADVAELAAKHPLRERLRGLLMRALCAEGRQAEALAGYDEFRRLLADELGVDPGQELQQTYLAVLRGPATPVRRSRGNLRTALTSFVGRDDEIAWIGARLRQDRLVTLVGPGGAGKTRLAVTVAAGLPQAAWLVELAPVTNPADVPQAVLGTLGPAYSGGAKDDSMARLVETLSGAETVLLLDNCEHVVDAVARLADEILGRCPRLRVLATSREPLGILGETLYPIPPLRLPTADDLGPAVRLFADRAAAVSPGFALTPANTGHVIEICGRLDGLPLAIELAAARLRVLTVEQVAARLDDRFRLLTGGSRTAMARHQTLRAVVAWSWDLLTGAERRLVARLAVFPAGFTVAAAESLGGTLDLVAALVDKSLLQLVEGPRYRMLETIREYALERLAESGDLVETRAAHAAYFLDLAETAEPHLRGGDQMTWITTLDTEHANLLAALHFAADRGDADTAVRLGAALSQFWLIRGKRSESAGWLRLALDVPGEAPAAARQIATALYLINSAVSANFAKLANTIEELEELAGLSGTEGSHPLLLLIEPALALFTDDTARGLERIGALLDHPDPWARATLHLLRAFIRENDGDRSGMHVDLTVAVTLYREIGERWGLGHALTSLADVLLVSGDFDGAIAALEEAITLVRQLSPDDDAGHQRIWLAQVRAQKGDVARARAELEEMAVHDMREWTVRNVVFARLGLGDIARWLGDLDEAARQYDLAVAEVTGLNEMRLLAPQFRALILTSRAHLAVEMGDLEAAAELVDQAANLTMIAKDMPVLARVGVAAAAVQARRGEPARGAVTLGATEQLRGAADRLNTEVVRVSGHLATVLGETAYGRAYANGVALARADAIAQVRCGSSPAAVGAHGEWRENGQQQH